MNEETKKGLVTPSDLAMHLPPVKVDDANKMGTNGMTSNGTYRNGMNWNDPDSWTD